MLTCASNRDFGESFRCVSCIPGADCRFRSLVPQNYELVSPRRASLMYIASVFWCVNVRVACLLVFLSS